MRFLEMIIHYFATAAHKFWVFIYIMSFIFRLLWRAIIHDLSKYSYYEAKLFSRITPKLKGFKYGSDEYRNTLKSIKPVINRHYQKNRHHPEYFKNGIDGMNLVDIVEMLCDWKAAVKRHSDGNTIIESIKHNKEKRFHFSEDLANIFYNQERGKP